MDELSKSLPISEGIVEIEQSGNLPANIPGACLNCEKPLHGPYCSACGQKNLPRRQRLGDLFMNFLGSFTSFDSKFFRTFRVLLFKPGQIIQEYNDGRREAYFHPARMYVFLSFIFFLILALIPEEDQIKMKDGDGVELTSEEKRQILDSVNVNWGQESWSGTNAKTIEKYDSIQNALPESERDGVIEKYFAKKMILLQQRYKSEKDVWRTYAENIKENIPKMIFLLLPIFALILKLLYIRRDFYYSEHLVFSVFFYDFMFLVGIIGLLISMISWLEWFSVVLVFLIFLYLYKAMRRVYGQRRFKTIIKFLLLNWIFIVFLGLAFTLNALITLILL
jgi:hypothetical protein